MKLRKTIAAALSAAMILSSFSAFAVENDIPVLDNLDTYLNLDTDLKAELPDEEVMLDATDVVETTDEPTLAPVEAQEQETEDEPVHTFAPAVPNIPLWDFADPLDWEDAFSEQVELNASDIAFGKCGYNLTWTLDAEGTLTISGTGNMYDYNSSNITLAPWGEYADSLKKLTINKGITRIGRNAFYGCSGFDGNLVIPDSVTSIDFNAFTNCSGFDGNLVIPDSITSIGSSAFFGCSGFDGNLVIPDSVTSIGSSVFHSCSGLTGDLKLPDSVTNIGNNAFTNCSGFDGNLVIPNSVTSIGESAFRGCSGLTGDLVIPDSITSIVSSAFLGCSGFDGNLVIPDSVTSIGNNAFTNCSGFDGNLVIPDSVTSIDFNAFTNCSGFDGNLVIPDSVTYIGNDAFYYCSGFDGNLIIPDSVTSISGGAFNGCSGLRGKLVIPDSVTSIGNNAFYLCRGFDGNLVLPDGITSIGNDAFNGCSGLTGNLVLPEDITNIGSSAFSGCRGLTGDLKLPDSVTSISDCAFSYCSGLTGDLVIPDSITSIGSSAFFGCSGFDGNLVIPDSVTSIGRQAFIHCSNLVGNLLLPDSIAYIGDNAFCYCYRLSDMYISKSEDSIGTGAFQGRVHWKYDLSKCKVSISNYICTGKAIIPSENDITVTSPNGKTLYYGTDFVVESAKNNVSVGTATAHIAPPNGGISILSQDVSFQIVGIDISGATVTFPDDISYQGEPCCPEQAVVVEGKTLVKGTDYTVSYSSNNGEGTGTATINGIGTYIGSKTVEFEIGPFVPKSGVGSVDINDPLIVEISVSGSFIYNGSAHTPKPVLVYHFVNPTTGTAIDYDMVEGTDYQIIAYENNINAGTAKIKIQGIGTFENEKTVGFIISPCALSDTEIADIPSYAYCLKDICPEPEIKIGDKVIVKDVDYELSYENNRNRGTASVIITGKGNLSGTLTKTFEITPRDGSRFVMIVVLI